MILHAGAMTENKGVDILVKSIILSKYSSKICLVLKGNDSYSVQNKLSIR